MKNYNPILFDLDGTLSDTGEGIINSVVYALNKYNIKVEDKRELFRFVGPPLHKSFESFYGFSPKKAQQAVEYYREYYAVKGIYENTVYNGVYSLLERLKADGKALAVATSKPEKFAKIVIESNNMSKYFSVVAGANLDGSRTKKADVIKYALNRLNTPNAVPVIVGDRCYDAVGAREAGIDSIGVLYGYGSIEEMRESQATYIAKTTEYIYRIIVGNSCCDIN